VTAPKETQSASKYDAPIVEHLYFHIPFCPKVCPYCCFYVEEGGKNKNQAFLDALLLEVTRAMEKTQIRPKTIYFGGGTPTALRVEQLEYLLGGLKSLLNMSALQEWTMEANPATVREDKAVLLKQLGVTRISLGVQSWSDHCLKILGRTHNAEQAVATYEILRAQGFPSVNIDLMFSIPGQSLREWESDLDTTIKLNPNHISAYCLTYEEDTDFFKKLTGGEFVQNEEHDAALFESTMDRLSLGGYEQYEISNHARAGAISSHNMAYWEGRDFLGFGPSAFSTVGEKRTQNVCDTAAYSLKMQAGVSPIHSEENLSADTRLRERIAFGLRMAAGLEADLLTPWAEETEHLIEIGLLEANDRRLRLTRRGRMLADLVASSFV
jgi:oxygen-independent coproporphyrinogen-3 oxidase